VAYKHRLTGCRAARHGTEAASRRGSRASDAAARGDLRRPVLQSRTHGYEAPSGARCMAWTILATGCFRRRKYSCRPLSSSSATRAIARPPRPWRLPWLVSSRRCKRLAAHVRARPARSSLRLLYTSRRRLASPEQRRPGLRSLAAPLRHTSNRFGSCPRSTMQPRRCASPRRAPRAHATSSLRRFRPPRACALRRK
jgi:hypothetical protein